MSPLRRPFLPESSSLTALTIRNSFLESQLAEPKLIPVSIPFFMGACTPAPRAPLHIARCRRRIHDYRPGRERFCGTGQCPSFHIHPPSHLLANTLPLDPRSYLPFDIPPSRALSLPIFFDVATPFLFPLPGHLGRGSAPIDARG